MPWSPVSCDLLQGGTSWHSGTRALPLLAVRSRQSWRTGDSTCYTVCLLPPLCWCRYLLYGHLGAVTGLATSSLGDLLVSVGQDRVAKLWRLAGAGAGHQAATGHNNHNTLPLLQPVR